MSAEGADGTRVEKESATSLTTHVDGRGRDDERTKNRTAFDLRFEWRSSIAPARDGRRKSFVSRRSNYKEKIETL